MADVLTEKQRHYNMSRIRSKNTKPEEVVRKYLFSKGFRYRKMVQFLLVNQISFFPSTKP